jgi:hypothetical protein
MGLVMSKDIPAFPTKINTEYFSNPSTIYETGMTLRDYFAGRAMQGMLSENSGIRYPTDELVDFAYKVADAMMKAREQ